MKCRGTSPTHSRPESPGQDPEPPGLYVGEHRLRSKGTEVSIRPTVTPPHHRKSSDEVVRETGSRNETVSSSDHGEPQSDPKLRFKMAEGDTLDTVQ